MNRPPDPIAAALARRLLAARVERNLAAECATLHRWLAASRRCRNLRAALAERQPQPACSCALAA